MCHSFLAENRFSFGARLLRAVKLNQNSDVAGSEIKSFSKKMLKASMGGSMAWQHFVNQMNAFFYISYTHNLENTFFSYPLPTYLLKLSWLCGSLCLTHLLLLLT